MKTNNERQADWAARHRAAGRVQRKRWAHPEDWPTIDSHIKRMEKKRENKS